LYNVRVYYPTGKNRKNERLGNKPLLVWISRERLIAGGFHPFPPSLRINLITEIKSGIIG